MHVVVTGASSGIGEAIAREYSAAGAAITLVARRKDRLEEIAAGLRGESLVAASDLAKPEADLSWLDRAQEKFGEVDILVNNAGMQIVGPTEKTEADLGEKLLRLNVHTPMRLTIRVLPDMLRRRRGTIVDIASMAALTPTPGMYYYNASKAALAAASESLRAELRGSGVHVVTVYPGPVHTPMGDKGITHYEKTWASSAAPWGTTEALAKLVRRAVDWKRARVIYPRSYGMARRFPNLAKWVVGRFTPPMREPTE